MTERDRKELPARELARMHRGNSAAHLSSAKDAAAQERGVGLWSQHLMLAASSQAIAASYMSLADAREAVQLYRKAAELYLDMGHDYWVVLSVAAGDASAVVELLPRGVASPSPLAVAFGLVAVSLRAHRRSDDLNERLMGAWRTMGNIPVGRLGVPLDHYVACAQAIRSAREKNIDAFLVTVRDYIGRAAEVRRTASHDHFHWNRFQSALLPAEPEAIAITTSMSIVAHDHMRQPLVEIAEFDEHGRALAQIGDNMQRALSSDKDGNRKAY